MAHKTDGGVARVCARVAINLMLWGCQIYEKFFYEINNKNLKT